MTNVIENETGATTKAVNLKGLHIKVKDGKKNIKVTVQDLVSEALACESAKEKVKGVQDKFDTQASHFQDHFLQFAADCATPEQFADLCYQIEQNELWGKAPKGTTKNVRDMYRPCPGTWKVYKSNILTAWKDADIKPLSHVTIDGTDDEGKVVPIKVKVDSIKKIRRLSKPEPTASTATPAMDDATLSPLAKVMNELGVLFEQLDDDKREEMLISLHLLGEDMAQYIGQPLVATA